MEPGEPSDDFCSVCQMPTSAVFMAEYFAFLDIIHN